MCGVISKRNKSKSIHLFSHKRKVFLRDGMIWSHSPFVYQEENEIEERIVRLEQLVI
jgi:hypothetical protein